MTINMLLSYAYHARANLAEEKRNIHCGRLMIDSGAFTAHTTGKTIHLKEYAEYLDHWKGHWDHAVTLDVIGDPAKSKVNTRKLHNQGLPVMPVFTRGESLKEFDAMVKDVGYVCVGGGVGMSTKQLTQRTALLQRRAEQLGGGIHALGVGSTRMLRSARPYSADSSNISGSLAFGKLYFFDGIHLRNLNVKDRKSLTRYRQELSLAGFDLQYFHRHGRIPSGTDNRIAIASRSAVGAAAAAEHLRHRIPVTAPTSTPDNDGIHIYLASSGDWSNRAIHKASAIIHSKTPPAVWRKYGRHHDCEYTPKSVTA